MNGKDWTIPVKLYFIYLFYGIFSNGGVW